jgi:type IV fimbrial biogenesis protein FimT
MLPMPVATLYLAGFTLTEVVVVTAIVATVAVLAAPPLVDVLACGRLRAASENLQASLSLARSEAVRRGGRVTVCRSVEPLSCDVLTGDRCECDTANGDWSSGWITYHEGSLDSGETVARIDSGEPIIQLVPGMERVTISGNSSVAKYISYTAGGRAQANSGAFQAGTMCLTDRQSKRRRALVLNVAGRVSLLQPDSGNAASACPSIAVGSPCL